MKKLSATVGCLLLTASVAQADEKYSHFPSLDAPTTTAALCNLATFNQKLQVIAKKKALTPEDMVKVHELTYTLENAVIRLKKDLDSIAVDLEKVHKASEHLDLKTIQSSGKDYLAATSLLVTPKSCN